MPQRISVAQPAVPRLPALLPGLALCGAIAAVAIALGRLMPLVGAPLFAVALGVVLANLVLGPARGKALQVGEIAKTALKTGIILLGASLDLGDILRTGWESLPVLTATLGAGLLCAVMAGAALGVPWRMRALIGMGTVICGASAIAATAPVVRARAEEIAYAISTIFLFNMVAVFTFPAIGHALHLNDAGFGLWTGTAVNDTSAVVAAGFAWSAAAGTHATVVKLTRTTLIIPLVAGLGLLMPLIEREQASSGSLGRKVAQAVPVFILLFAAASLLQTLGLVGAAGPGLQLAGRWVMVLALAAVGLQGHWRAFAGAGLRPLLLGLLTWATVAVTSLAVQSWTGLL